MGLCSQISKEERHLLARFCSTLWCSVKKYSDGIKYSGVSWDEDLENQTLLANRSNTMFSGCSMRVNNLLHSLTVAVWTWPDWVAGRCDNKERVTFYDKLVCNTWLGFSTSTKQIRTFTLVLSIKFFSDYFYLLIFYFLKFSTWIWGFQFTVIAWL